MRANRVEAYEEKKKARMKKDGEEGSDTNGDMAFHAPFAPALLRRGAMQSASTHLPVRSRCRPQLLSLRAQRRREDEGKAFSFFGHELFQQPLGKEANEAFEKQRETLPALALLP
eukprot:762663-Hanusia_phi.AAC.1